MMPFSKILKNIKAQSLARVMTACWLVLILIASVFGRSIQRSFDWASSSIPLVALALLLTMLIVFSLFYKKRFSSAQFSPAFTGYIVAISVLAIAFGYLILHSLVTFPIEAAHLVKFAPLGFLLFWGSQALSLKTRLLWSLALGIAVGTGEETLQLFIPDRFFDWKDLAFNALSAALGSIYAGALYWGLGRYEMQSPKEPRR
jgi:VanZ family protein